jgi:phosphatidate cytidylyltransferase
MDMLKFLLFFLIWTFCGSGKNKIVRTYIPKKTIEGFMGGCILFVASYLISKYYIEIAEGKMFIWIIIALIVGVLVYR